MADLNARMPRIDTSRFAMIPSSSVPRSSFMTSASHKTTFKMGHLIPIYVDEVLPADVHQGRMTYFARLATMQFPILDQLTLETHFFFIPYRLVWKNWVKLQGEQDNPDDSVSYTVPQIESPEGGYAPCSVFDYMGLPTVGQLIAGRSIRHSALPLRAMNLVYNEWYRDQNLQDRVEVLKDSDGPDDPVYYGLYQRNKRPDYLTTALPWPLKGGVDVTLPLAGSAPVQGIAFSSAAGATAGSPGVASRETGGNVVNDWNAYAAFSSANFWYGAVTGTGANQSPEIYADLSNAVGATMNDLRNAVLTQQMLELDARGGTRYTESLTNRWGVRSLDQRMQRPEFIGGGRSSIQTQAIPQTSETTTESPLGALGAAATSSDMHSFHYNAVEHGCILGFVNVFSEITYQQGVHKMWMRETRLDHYEPIFANLGEQAILNHEIYCVGSVDPILKDGTDWDVFGYQERWSEYRYAQGKITGMLKSTTALNIDEWHLAQQFGTLPTLNNTFLYQNVPYARVAAAADLAENLQVIFDSVFQVKKTRAMPTYSIPGITGRF